MPRMSYGRAMAWLAERDPDGVAIIHEDESATRIALEQRSNRLARAYAELGVREGDLVTLALPNSIEFFAACLASWKLGATPQPISARLPELERRAIIELVDPALLVGAEVGAYGDRPTLAAGYSPPNALSDAPLPDRVSSNVRAMTSGGSTGRPKVIVDITPALCDPEVAENDMRPGGATLVPGPLYHSGPFITAWQALLSGGHIVVLSRFDAALCLQLIERHRVDWVLFVPTMMQRIWRLPAEERECWDLSSLRVVMCSGAASPVWLKRAWIDWLGPERIHEAYGGSERIAGTRISGSEWLEHPGSVGKPSDSRKIRILDSDGNECPPGQIGELYMMPADGPGSTYRYIGAEPTVSADGWESLGDMGYLDKEGYLYLVDRKTDMIVSGGANVYPAEIEAALDAHPAVQSSAVIGLPDDDLGQRIHAIVEAQTALSDEELRAHLEQHLVRYKIPRSFEYVKQPLRDDAGKVRRSALREARLPSTRD
ncbi:MAG: acid--CoA ligase [Deltaproteobacteria bacterium]|nr:MAG: acid--CoA ligase [Deltaproteobacteria bacterium]